MTTIVECYLETDKLSDDRTIVSISDLHITKNGDRYIGLKNILRLIQTLDKIDFDYLLVPGDIINDTKDLEDVRFCNNLSYALKELMHDKLSFFSLGNHDLMTKGINGWEKGNVNLLKEILNDLPNAILLDGFDSFSLNDDILLEKGISKANINIVGVSMPFEYYERDKEGDLSFWNYWNNSKAMRGTKYTTLDKNSYNILMLHSLRNYIEMSRTCGYNIYPNVDFAVGGHYHNGAIPNWLCPFVKGDSGVISPQMEFFPETVRGLEKVNDMYAHMGGYTNFRVENPMVNSLMGGPYIFILHLFPMEKGKEKGGIKVKKYLK